MLLYWKKIKKLSDSWWSKLVKASLRMWLLLKKWEKVVDQSNGLKTKIK